MTKKKRSGDAEPTQGELIRRRSPEAVPLHKAGISERLLSIPSKWSFLNRFTQASVESATGVARAQKDLVSAMKDLGIACQELDDVKLLNEKAHDIRVRERMEAAEQLEEARWKEKARKEDKKIFDINKDIEVAMAQQRKQYEVETQDLANRKKLAELKKQVADLEKPEAPEKTPRGSPAARKQAEITREVRRYEKQKERIESGSDSAAAKKKLLRAADITHQQAMRDIPYRCINLLGDLRRPAMPLGNATTPFGPPDWRTY